MPSNASRKVTTTTILLQRKAGPWNETLEKRKEQTVFYDRFQPSVGPGKKHSQFVPNNICIFVTHPVLIPFNIWRKRT